MSSVHYALDTRIFFKMCHALNNEYDVSLIANHPQKETINNIQITPFKVFKNRRNRVFFSWILMFFKAIKINAKVYHFHDPELIPCGLLLRILGKKVIYDVHENIAEDIFDKPWIKYQKTSYQIFNFFEKIAVKNFKIILAEKSYEKRYKTLNANAVVIQNFCDLEFFEPFVKKEYHQTMNLFYIGIVLENRGILEILETVYELKKKGYPVHFHLVGELYSDLDQKIKKLEYFDTIKDDVTFYGRLPLNKGYQLAERMDIGLCIIWPMKNSIESYPTKIFEYMAVGLPIITSNFDLYKELVEENNCGICVNPKSTKEIFYAVETLYTNVQKSEQMVKNGKNAVKNKYDWESQKQVLIRLYDEILKK